MSIEENRALAHAYFAGVSAGELPDAILNEDMTAWITSGATMDKAAYQRVIRILAAMCEGPLRFTVDALTAEGDRVVAEARSQARLIDGTDYAQTYVFVFRIRDGRIAHVAEHYNAIVSQQKLVPLMAEAARKVDG